MAVQVRGHVAVITETESTYITIESTMRFDDVEVIGVPGLLPLLLAVQRSRMRSRKRSRSGSGRQPGKASGGK